MTRPNNKKSNPVADRFHTILSGGQKLEPEPEKEKVNEKVSDTQKSPIQNLPKAKPDSTSPTPSMHPAGPQSGFRLKLTKEQILPALWTFSSAVNLILAVILIIVIRSAANVNAMGIGSGLLGGLYTNFERMDNAHIKTSIPVQTNIPLNMDIPVQTTTGITLAQDVVIHNAHVKIATDTFNIDSSADVTLPAGTPLNIVLNFSVPVQTQVPVTLNVPVDIPLKDTELHPAIAGLQDTIKPLYCIFAPTALTSSGKPVCR